MFPFVEGILLVSTGTRDTIVMPTPFSSNNVQTANINVMYIYIIIQVVCSMCSMGGGYFTINITIISSLFQD